MTVKTLISEFRQYKLLRIARGTKIAKDIIAGSYQRSIRRILSDGQSEWAFDNERPEQGGTSKGGFFSFSKLGYRDS